MSKDSGPGWCGMWFATSCATCMVQSSVPTLIEQKQILELQAMQTVAFASHKACEAKREPLRKRSLLKGAESLPMFWHTRAGHFFPAFVSGMQASALGG